MGIKEVLDTFQQDVRKEIGNEIKTASVFFKRMSLAQTFFLVCTIGVGVWFATKVIHTLHDYSGVMNKQGSNIELLMKNIQVMNEPAVLLKIIREKAPTLPAETQCRATDAIFRTCEARNIPLPLACAIAEVESRFNPAIKDSPTGAVGWFQTMPAYARSYMNFFFGGYSREHLREPVTNAIVGLNEFADLRDAAKELGLDDLAAIKDALGHYNWGNTIGSSAYAIDVLNRAKVFADRFETSLKELRKTN
jgi:soluble lytic murein transglycosylase-like protein